MKKTRKLIALLLATIMAFSGVSVATSAAPEYDCCPSIIIPGLFQSETKYYEDGKVATNLMGEPYAEPFFMDSTVEIVGAALTEVLVPITDLLISQEDKEEKAAYALADLLGETLLGKQQLDETGHFINDIRATKYLTSFDELSAHDQETVLDHFPMEYYIEKAGGDKLYVFSYASLDNMIDTAEALYDYIQMVKEQSGYEKVNIVPISQGGSIANALLQMYYEAGISVSRDINRIVYVVPALNGSTLVGEVYQYGIIDDDNELYMELLPALLGEGDMVSYLLNIVLRLFPNADLNNILDVVVKQLVMDYTRYSTLLWGLCPSENYPACREMYLTDDSTKLIVEQTDWFYNAQLRSDENILWAQEDGVKIFDIVDYNFSLYHIVDSWDDIAADGIIQVDSTSMGAYSAGGTDVQLPDGYVTPAELNNCTDPDNHNHKDPYNILDINRGLLPETTFYFYEQSHEKTASNDVVMKLASTLLMDENFVDVHSYPDKFPQFNNARNTKGLMNRMEEMENYDMSHIKDEALIYELEDARIQAQAMLDNTVIDLEEVEAATNRYYRASDAIYNYTEEEVEPEEKENTAYMDFSYLLSDLFYILSQVLYIFFGGDGFSDM